MAHEATWGGETVAPVALLRAELDFSGGTRSGGLAHVGFDAAGDGGTRAKEAGGRRCRENVPFRDHLSYFHFDLEDGFLRGGPAQVAIEYLDLGEGSWTLHYDALDDSAPVRGAYKALPAVAFTGSQRWRTKTFSLPDARFAGRQNSAADFRVHSTTPLRIASVRMWKGQAQ